MAKNAQAGKPANPQATRGSRKPAPPATPLLVSEQQTGEAGDVAPPSPPGGGAGGEGAPPATPEPVITHLLVTSRREGFRRAGRPWSVAPTLVSIDEFTPGQILDLFAEPMFDTVGMTDTAAMAWVADQLGNPA